MGKAISLCTLGSPQTTHALRDELIRQDRCQLALLVASKSGIQCEPIWAAMGLALLKIGRFPEAKFYFEKIRPSRMDWASLLKQIVSLLEEEDGLAFNASRYMQCIYYLTKYGTPNGFDIISFWLRHQLIEDAFRFVLKREIAPQLFLATIFKHCACRGTLLQLQQLFTQIDPTFAKSTKYLYAICQWLARNHAFTVLLDWQIFMRDHGRSALTCRKLFKLSQSIPAKRQYLQACLGQLALITQLTPQQLSLSSQVQHQLEIMSVFSDQPKLLSTLTFFEDNAQIIRVCVELLLFSSRHFDLAYRLMQYYRLPVGQIFDLAATQIASFKVHNVAISRLQELTDFMRGTVDDNDWDRVHQTIDRKSVV